MARQSTTPVPFQRSNRTDTGTLYSSARAGKTVLCAAIPVLRGDSAAGAINIAAILAEMPKPLRNAVAATVQAWFVPKTTDPRFASNEEFIASYQGDPIKRLGQDDAAPLPFYRVPVAGESTYATLSDHIKTLGIHHSGNAGVFNLDIFEMYNTIWNFRAAAHSSHLPLRDYYPVAGTASGADPYWKFARAFWPQNRFSGVVADYEAALVQGQLSLDVEAGKLPVYGMEWGPSHTFPAVASAVGDAGFQSRLTGVTISNKDATSQNIIIQKDMHGLTPDQSNRVGLFAEMGGRSVLTSLADIDKARTTQAFAKMRTAYAGNDTTGYSNDDAIIAELMQGFTVPQDVFKRPWLLDSKVVDFGMVERHATDAANLDKSITRGVFQQRLSINLPKQDVGGMIMVVLEVVPHRIYERQGDPSISINVGNRTGHLPDALRDVQRPLPVDTVPNWRIDAAHQTPTALYGYEPMNDKWRRQYTRLGGDFYQATAGAGDFNEARSALWIPEIVNPNFTADHYLVPQNFPHNVFSDTTGSAFEFQVDHNITFNGLTQFGDVLQEDNNEWQQTQDAS